MPMKFTYFGHSCFSVQVGGQTLLFDPFITPNELAAAIRLEEIAADVILVSHGHFDHIADAAAIANRTGALVISNYEIYDWLGKQGLTNLHPMNLGGAFEFPFGRVKLTPAVHSSVLPDGTYGGNPGGFVVSTGEGDFYYAGDTALTFDMKLIADEFAPRFAVLPIGDNFTMGAADAAKAAQFVGAKKAVGVHYDTFPPIRIDKEAARVAFSDAGIELLLPAIGESVDL